MSKKNDEGSAFPAPEVEWQHTSAGISLRDWFAGIAQVPDWEPTKKRLANVGAYEASVSDKQVAEERARLRYIEADAMLEARKK
jgi:hypothetical protein